MEQKKTFDDFREDMRRLLEHIAVMRRVGIDLGFGKERIDAFISEEGAKQFEKMENASEIEMMIYMLNDIMENAPEDVKSTLL